jgi:hypothetical protein
MSVYNELTISSAQRTTPGFSSASNFEYIPPFNINTNTLTVKWASIPQSWYTIPAGAQLTLILAGGAPISLAMQIGNYNITTIVASLNYTLNSSSTGVTASANNFTGRITFSHSTHTVQVMVYVGDYPSAQAMIALGMMAAKDVVTMQSTQVDYIYPAIGATNTLVGPSIFFSQRCNNLLITSETIAGAMLISLTTNTSTIDVLSELLYEGGTTQIIATVPVQSPFNNIFWANPNYTRIKVDSSYTFTQMDFQLLDDYTYQPIDLNGADWTLCLGYFANSSN